MFSKTKCFIFFFILSALKRNHMVVLKKNIIGHFFFIVLWREEEVSDLEQVFTSTFLFISTIRMILAWSSFELLLLYLSELSQVTITIFFFVSPKFLFFFLVEDSQPSCVQAFCIQSKWFHCFPPCISSWICFIFSFGGMLKLSFLFHHLFKLPRHKSHLNHLWIPQNCY